MQTTATPNHSEPVLTQRRGKIARLPRAIRDQLNTRLDDGQEADDILPWLNSLPEVQEIITRRFDGVCISPQNLSVWRQGGFQEWLLHKELLDTAVHVRENLTELGDSLGHALPEDVPLLIADQMLAQICIRFNAFLASWTGGPLEDHLAMMLKLGQFIVKLQQSVYRARRQAIELPGLVRKAERDYEREIKAELFREHMADLRKEKPQNEEKPKKPAPKNGAPNTTVQPIPQPEAGPSQSRAIKANQATREPSSTQPPAPTVVHTPVVGPVAPRAVHFSSVLTP